MRLGIVCGYILGYDGGHERPRGAMVIMVGKGGYVEAFRAGDGVVGERDGGTCGRASRSTTSNYSHSPKHSPITYPSKRNTKAK